MVASFAGIMTSTAFGLGLKKGGGERPRCDDLVAPLMQDRSAATLFHGERLLRPANVSLACASHRWRAVSHSALRGQGTDRSTVSHSALGFVGRCTNL
jgi:hypothetical protein